MKNQMYRMHVDSVLRIKEMGYDYNEGECFLDLPNIEGLHEAVALINKACSLKLEQSQKNCLDQFCAQQYNKLRKAQGSSNSEVRDIMKETAEYYKGRKSCLQAKEESKTIHMTESEFKELIEVVETWASPVAELESRLKHGKYSK